MKVAFHFLRSALTAIALSLAGGQVAVTSIAAQTQLAPSEVASIPVEDGGENYLFIQARINGGRPMTFILDTGGGSGIVLYHQAAVELGSKLNGNRVGTGGGAGEESFPTTLIQGATVNISGANLNDQTLVVFPPDRTALPFDREIDGVIGFPIFDRYVVEIDYASNVVELYEPKTFQYTGAGESLPIKIQHHFAYARMQVSLTGKKSIAGEFLVDTGAGRFAAIINTPLVDANRLAATAPRTIQEPGAEGVGGDVKMLAGRLPGVELGHFDFTDPVIHLAQDRKGVLASSDFAGVIGGELLHRFKVIFDYPHKRMILEPNAELAAPFVYDMSGLRLRPEGADFRTWRIRRVLENSPASDAGVRQGDVIAGIDDKPATALTLALINRMFKQEGKELILDLLRGQEKMRVKLKLRKMI